MQHLLIQSGKISNLELFRVRFPALLTALLCCQTLAAAAPDLTLPKIIVPEHIAGVTTLTAEEVVELANSKHNLIIIDARISADRKHGYLEDSLSLPDIKTNCPELGKIIPDKNTPTLFYCNGIKCGRSVVSVKIAKLWLQQYVLV